MGLFWKEKKICFIIEEIQYIAVMETEADGMASSVGPDKNALGSVLLPETRIFTLLCSVELQERNQA